MAREKPDPRTELQKAIRAMPDADHPDPLLRATSVRLELLGFAELAEALDDIAVYGAPRVEVPVIERIRTVAAATGWAMHEKSHVDTEWGTRRTELTLTYGKNTINATINGVAGYLGHATWRIADVGYQYHAILAPQRKYHRIDTVLEWMRRVLVEPAVEDEVPT
jgi:hypothetical protein